MQKVNGACMNGQLDRGQITLGFFWGFVTISTFLKKVHCDSIISIDEWLDVLLDKH